MNSRTKLTLLDTVYLVPKYCADVE